MSWSTAALRLNTLRPRQNGRHFADDTFKRIFLSENVGIAIKISLKYVLYCPINNMSALVQVMAWRRPGDKPLTEPMVVRLLTHICVTRPQWVKEGKWFISLAKDYEIIFSCIVRCKLVKSGLNRDWSRLIGSYVNSTFVICCPGKTSLCWTTKVGRCCCNSLPIEINPLTSRHLCLQIYSQKPVTSVICIQWVIWLFSTS